MKRLLVLCVLLMLPTGLEADVGDLTPVPSEPNLSLQRADLRAGPRNFANRTDGDGTISRHAVIATFRLPSGPPLKVAIDSKSADAKAPEVIRMDFTGEGKFQDTPVVPLVAHQSGRNFHARIGPATIQVQRNGKSIPVRVSGQYNKGAGYRNLSLRLATALQGDCRFGDKTYRVRIIDCDNNLQCRDKAKTSTRRGKVTGIRMGDTLAVDTGEGKFGESVATSFYGQPVLVDGTWYDVTVSPDGTKVTAEPSNIKSAILKIPHDKWQISLAGKKSILVLSGSQEAVEIPADFYTIVDFQQYGEVKDGFRAQLTTGREELSRGRAKTFNAPEGETAEPVVGTPLVASIKAKVRRRAVQMDFRIVDASGASVDLSLGGGSQVTPKLEVRDATGKKVHTGKFEYG